MRDKKLITMAIFLFTLSWTSQGFALLESTHKAINEDIAQRTINSFSLSSYLRDYLGFKSGIDEALSGVDAGNPSIRQKVFQWLGYGGIQEDRPGDWSDYILGRSTRSVNHFHNPLKSWSEAGLNDRFLGQRTGESQVLWAQNPNQSLGGNWSWQDARRYFYIALTGKDYSGNVIAPTKNERERYLADSFRAVGQLMHLVQDASVPEHVRNDLHILPAYEAEVEDIRNKRPDLWGRWISSPVSFDKSALNISSQSPASVPVSRIIDTDKYSASNPDATNGSAIGIAEYTNANFLSADTMFTNDLDPTDRHYFPYPRGSGASSWRDTTNNRLYLAKAGEGEAINHLAVVSLLYLYRLKYFPQLFLLPLPVGLDDKVYEEYGSKLIPRAVGYSAGLLEYFFRGKLDSQQTDTKPNGEIEFTITNLSDDPLGEGLFCLFYDSATGERKEISLDGGPVTSLPKDGTHKVTFVPPTDFEPGKENQYMLVYKGQLGNEELAIIGRQVKFESTDMVVFYRKEGQSFIVLTNTMDLENRKSINGKPASKLGFILDSSDPMQISQKKFNHKGKDIYYIVMPISLNGEFLSEGGSTDLSNHYIYDPENGRYFFLGVGGDIGGTFNVSSDYIFFIDAGRYGKIFTYENGTLTPMGSTYSYFSPLFVSDSGEVYYKSTSFVSPPQMVSMSGYGINKMTEICGRNPDIYWQPTMYSGIEYYDLFKTRERFGLLSLFTDQAADLFSDEISTTDEGNYFAIDSNLSKVLDYMGFGWETPACPLGMSPYAEAKGYCQRVTADKKRHVLVSTENKLDIAFLNEKINSYRCHHYNYSRNQVIGNIQLSEPEYCSNCPGDSPGLLSSRIFLNTTTVYEEIQDTYIMDSVLNISNVWQKASEWDMEGYPRLTFLTGYWCWEGRGGGFDQLGDRSIQLNADFQMPTVQILNFPYATDKDKKFVYLQNTYRKTNKEGLERYSAVKYPCGPGCVISPPVDPQIQLGLLLNQTCSGADPTQEYTYKLVTPYETISFADGNEGLSYGWMHVEDLSRKVLFQGVQIHDSQGNDYPILYYKGKRIESTLASMLDVSAGDILGILLVP